MTSIPPRLSADRRPTRRSILRSGATAAAAATLLPRRAAAVHLTRKPKLRVLGTHVTLQETLRRRAESDLGIEIEFMPGGSADVLQTASTAPDSFDIYEQWSNSIEILWQAGAIRGIPIERLGCWSEVNDLCKTGRLTENANIGAGAAPKDLLWVQADGELSSRASDEISFVPYVHNVDSFGYDLDHVRAGTPYETESWAWLLDPEFRGKVGIVNEPTIGLFDLALACQASGLIEFEDIGEMTRDELDELYEILERAKRDGQFEAFWNSVPHSIDLMRGGRVRIASMFSPAVSALNGMGKQVVYAAPREGYRAWHGVMCLSSKVAPETEEAAFAYMNWWLSGWPGAFVARQGYYIATPERSREFLSEDEWAYWYEGAPAERALFGVDGSQCVRAGESRRGGSYLDRFERITVWNTVMDNYEYSLRRWYSLLTA